MRRIALLLRDPFLFVFFILVEVYAIIQGVAIAFQSVDVLYANCANRTGANACVDGGIPVLSLAFDLGVSLLVLIVGYAWGSRRQRRGETFAWMPLLGIGIVAVTTVFTVGVNAIVVGAVSGSIYG